MKIEIKEANPKLFFNGARSMNVMEQPITTRKSGSFRFHCPYCHEIHAGELENRVFQPKDGIIRVLSTLPCQNKIILFFSESYQLRGHETIDATNAVDYNKTDNGKEETATNYNDDYKKFMESRGMQSRLKKKMECNDQP